MTRTTMQPAEIIRSAAYHPTTWNRRRLVLREVRWMSRLKRLTMSEALVAWATESLRIRCPTTVMTYWHTAVAVVLGGVRHMTPEQREWFRGLVVLYGRTAWYGRAAELTRDEAKAVVFSNTAPLWLRVWMDVAWHAVGRAADLQYLTHNDVVVQEGTLTVYFMFLKNATDGALGAVKTLNLWRMSEFVKYRGMTEDAAQLFPMTTAAINRELQNTLPARHTTRDVRRGGAVLLTASGTAPAQIARQMAHRSEETQRTYTQMANAALTAADRVMQTTLSGPTLRVVGGSIARSGAMSHDAVRSHECSTPTHTKRLSLTSVTKTSMCERGERPVGIGLALVAATTHRGVAQQITSEQQALQAALPTGLHDEGWL